MLSASFFLHGTLRDIAVLQATQNILFRFKKIAANDWMFRVFFFFFFCLFS